MVTFAYRATDARGEVRNGLVQGGSEAQAKAALRRQGLYPLEIEERAPARAAPGALDGLRRLRSPRGELPAFTRSLASFLAAGFPLDRALAMCAELVSHPRLDTAIRRVRRDVQTGRSLAAALEGDPALFDPLYSSSVGAAERAGALDAGLASLAAHLEERRELGHQLRSILLYPAVMAVVGALAVAVMMVFVLPRFADILEGAGQSLPWATSLLLGVSRTVGRWWWAILALALLAGAFVRAWARTAEGRRSWDAALLSAPGLGTLVRKLVAARFGRSLGTLLQNGVPLPAALRLSADTLGNVVATQAVRDAQGRVREGESLAAALGRSDVLPGPALRMVAVGEETGRLEDLLLRTAELYEGEVRRDLRTLVGLVEPAMILVLGALVGFVALAMIQAVFSINEVPL
ncbi:MAG TPA: type II secretion system F family protein [Gemmatimonadota bacterium]